MRWSLPRSQLQAPGPWPGAPLAHPEPTCSNPGLSGVHPSGWATCRGSCVPLAASWFPGCSSWTPPWPPFQLLFSLHALPSPGLDFCPVSIVMLWEGDLKRYVSDDVTLYLKTPPWPSTALSIKTNTSCVVRQVLHSLGPSCLFSTLFSNCFEPFVSHPTTRAFSPLQKRNCTTSVSGTGYMLFA